jgi:N6-adenosine-specific RNA methylase IME4
MTRHLPTGRFGAVFADPPWPYATYSAKGKGRSAEAHYDTMAIEDIAALPVALWAVPDWALFLWVTKPQLVHALAILTIWGFTNKTVGFTWIKTIGGKGEPGLLDAAPLRFAFGLGHWTRANPEMCLLATRGKPHRLNADVPELIVAPRSEHSRKPDDILERIERLVAGPYLELFASSVAPHREGWTRWIGRDRAAARRWKSDSYPGAEAAR